MRITCRINWLNEKRQKKITHSNYYLPNKYNTTLKHTKKDHYNVEFGHHLGDIVVGNIVLKKMIILVKACAVMTLNEKFMLGLPIKYCAPYVVESKKFRVVYAYRVAWILIETTFYVHQSLFLNSLELYKMKQLFSSSFLNSLPTPEIKIIIIEHVKFTTNLNKNTHQDTNRNTWH